jgi:hypothetical protein
VRKEDMMDAGTVGGLVGSALGVLGGAVGTYFSIKNTSGPKERSFVIRAAVVAWLVVLALVAGLLLIPRPYNWFLWIPYGVLLAVGIRHWNRKQAEIRNQEIRGA